MSLTEIPYTSRKPHEKQRPLGSLCIYCNAMPARPNRKPSLSHLATNYCSDRHKDAHLRNRRRQEMRELADDIRWMVGLPEGRGWQFTAPELRALHRRLFRHFEAHGALPQRAAVSKRRGKAA